MEWIVREQGPKAVIEVWRENDGEGLFQAFIVGDRSRFLLGTLAPENGQLRLRRICSIDSLRRQGCWPVRSVREELVCSFREPEIQWEDPVLRRSAQSLPRHSLRREGEGFSLIFPFDSRAPFPLTPVFCFARVEQARLIFSFRKGGIPYIFRPLGKNREETEQRREPYGESDHEGAWGSGGPARI